MLSLDDYKRIYDDCVSILNDMDSNVPTPNMEEWDAEAAEKYAYVKAMCDCLNDAPCGDRVDYYVKKGLKLPEIDF